MMGDVSRDGRQRGDGPASRTLHWMQSLSARASAAAWAAAVSVAVLGWAVVSDDQTRILTWFEAVASAITLVIVFVLQHTQTREQVTLQRKLDEVLHALPGADDRLIQLESATGDDIDAAAERHGEIREQADP
jgi:low affinity Fe/Cu permease